MDLTLTQEEREIREWVRTFVRNEILPLEQDVLARERRNEPGLTGAELASLQHKASAAGFFPTYLPWRSSPPRHST